MSNKVRLGYIGLGNMGSPMATKMTEWPGGITVYDIRTEAMTPLAEKGANLADSVADVAVADIIHITVLDDAQVREVVRELAAHAKPETVIAIHSTISDTTAAELARELKQLAVTKVRDRDPGRAGTAGRPPVRQPGGPGGGRVGVGRVAVGRGARGAPGRDFAGRRGTSAARTPLSASSHPLD